MTRHRCLALAVASGIILCEGPGSALAQVIRDPSTGEAIQELTDLDLADLLRAPDVESASRRKQSLEEAPAAMDSLTSDDIITAGLVSLADVLRRVPGLFVTQTNANRFDVGLRGVHALTNNRVLVLINGRRVTEFSQGAPAWQRIPIHPAEIDRIEVLRGPGTILYGADAVSGVISITTKQPLDSEGVNALFAAGNTWLPDEPGDLRSARVQNLGNGYVAYSRSNQARTLGLGLTAGWSHVPNWVPPDETSIERHGDFGIHVGGSLEWQPSELTSVVVDARAVQSEGLGTLDSLMAKRFVHYGSEYVAAFKLTREQLLPEVTFTVSGDVRRASEATKMLVPRSYFEPVSETNPQDRLIDAHPKSYRGHVLAQMDAAFFHGRSLLSGAVESSYEKTSAFYGPDASQMYYAFVLQNETHFLHRPELIANLGARVEQANVEIDGRGHNRHASISPRGSLILRLNESHSLRATAASAYRSPTLWELTDLTNEVPGYPEPVRNFYTMKGNLSLQSEEVRSIELGYRGRPTYWMRIDLDGYFQELKNPILYKRTMVPLVYENGATRTQTGVELGIKLRPIPAIGGHLSYAWTHTSGTEGRREFPTHILQVGASALLRDYRMNVDFNYASTIRKMILQSGGSAVVSMDSTSNSQLLLNARVGRQMLGGRAEVFIQATNLLAPFRSRQSLFQYPFNAADPIGLVVLAGAQVREAPAGALP